MPINDKVTLLRGFQEKCLNQKFKYKSKNYFKKIYIRVKIESKK